MATDPDSNDGSWSELEQGFFATAPPDVPVPPPEPMRFDDLDPIVEPRRRSAASEQWRARATRAWAATAPARGRLRTATAGTRVVLAKTASATGRTLRATAATTRTRLRSVSLAVVREGRPRITRLVVFLRNVTVERRALTAAIATLLVATGVSAGVVASRDSSQPVVAAKAAPPPPAPALAPSPAVSTPLKSETPSESPAEPSNVAAAAPALDPVPPTPPRPVVRKAPARTRAGAPARAVAQKKPEKPAVTPAAKKPAAPARAAAPRSTNGSR